MFQTFDSPSDPSVGRARVGRLREWLERRGLDGFLVPRADQHQGEYVAAGSERLRWLTGFAGSAGVALILRERALIFVDGRYTLQVRDQVDLSIFTPESLVDTPPPAWIEQEPRQGRAHRLRSLAAHHRRRQGAARGGRKGRRGHWCAVDRNPIDELWTDRPAPPLEKIEIHPIDYAGELAKDKLARLAAALAGEGVAHTVLTDTSSIAWAFNIRGSDVPHTPVVLAFAVLSAEGPHLLFIDKRKLAIETEAYLTQLADLCPPSALDARACAACRRRRQDRARPGARRRASARPGRGQRRHGGGRLPIRPACRAPPRTRPRSPARAPPTAATAPRLSRMLAWLDRQAPGTIDEITAVEQLEEFRRQTGEETQMPLRDISFDTISGAGPNGAIMHYRVSHGTNRPLAGGRAVPASIPAAQYQDGTTDITRTVAVGQPTRQRCAERYTIVLKGMVGISMLRFPAGTRGADIDVVARIAHWKAGLDYAPWHRPWRRLLSVGARGAAAHRQDRHRTAALPA